MQPPEMESPAAAAVSDQPADTSATATPRSPASRVPAGRVLAGRVQPSRMPVDRALAELTAAEPASPARPEAAGSEYTAPEPAAAAAPEPAAAARPEAASPQYAAPEPAGSQYAAPELATAAAPEPTSVRQDAPQSTGESADGRTDLGRILADERVVSLLQPIVELETGAVVGYEALARGPAGLLEAPDGLFAAARAEGVLAQLDDLCRRAALRAGLLAGVDEPLWLFVNVEPEVLDAAPVQQLMQLTTWVSGRLRIVLEITERALATRPAELLRTVQRVRAAGWKVALDDVGAEDMSLAFMPLLQPEVVKLDMRLVQGRPGAAVAAVMNAVNLYVESTGAVLLAEGIETESQLAAARGLGARLGQGYLFGRPSPHQVPGPVTELVLPAMPAVDWSGVSPFRCLPGSTPLRRSPKALLIELSKHLEREAIRHGSSCVVAAAFQEAANFTPATAARYRTLAANVGFVAALGDGLSAEPVAGVRGAALAPDDELRGEWDIVVLSPHFAAALLARDLGDHGPDQERTFEFAVTYRREVVTAAAQAMLSRVAPQLPAALPVAPSGRPPGRDDAPSPEAQRIGVPEQVLRRALSATSNGVTICDMRLPDEPLVYVNTAFERLSGLRAEDVLGRNCRFLQTEGTDPDAVARVREAVLAGRECRETLLNRRGPDDRLWWNEVYLAPVFDGLGRIAQYIGVQIDVTERVLGEQELLDQRERSEAYLQRIEQLAYTDSLTGLLNRRRITELLEAELWEAAAAGGAVALLFLDLDRFKLVNDGHGHAAGDDVLRETATRTRGRLRRRDLLARLGGDEFLVVLPDLEPATARQEAQCVADELSALLSRPVDTPAGVVPVRVSIGVSTFPADGADFDALVHAADKRMYAAKQSRSAPGH